MSLLDTASLIVTPNAYKEGKLYSVIPSDGAGDINVVRATTATRVNADGLVELVPYNLVQYSEQFNNGVYQTGNATITPNAITAPDGTLTADRVQFSVGVSYVYQGPFTSAFGNTVTLSVYLKGATAQTLGFNDGANNPNSVNITTEWQRYEFTFTQTQLNGGIQIDNYFGVSPSQQAKDFYIWGAQLNEGTLKPYQKTETRLNIPRIDYSNGTCPSLLVEPQRTNVILYSSSFDNAGWVKVPLGGTALTTVVTANDTISPSGIQDADKIFMSLGGGTTTSDWARLQSQSFNQTSGTLYTISFWAWASQSSEVGKVVRVGIGGNTAILDFTLTATATRFTVSYTAASTGTDSLLFQLRGAQGLASTAEFYLWGAQLEAGTYPTSYIPTTSASVTRNADVISKTGISSLIGQTEGTLFVDFYNYGNNSTITGCPICIANGGFFGNAIYIEQYLGNWYAAVWNGTSQQFISSPLSLSVGRHKLALAYKLNDIAFYSDGVLVATDTSATIPTCNGAYIGAVGTSTTPEQLAVNAAALWQTRLTNAQLAELTTI